MKYFILILVILFYTNACADELKDKVDKLKILPLQNGENFMKISNRDTLIINGEYKGDSYVYNASMIMQKQDNVWQVVHDDWVANEGVIFTDNETYEDKLYGVRRFLMVPKSDKTDKNYSALYVLESKKDYPDKEKHTLYKLDKDNDFDTLIFREVSSE